MMKIVLWQFDQIGFVVDVIDVQHSKAGESTIYEELSYNEKLYVAKIWVGQQSYDVLRSWRAAFRSKALKRCFIAL